MIVSLNEVETTILKAARGAGMTWGLAEEAAQAARWLAARRIPFEVLLVALFEAEPWRAEIDFVGGVLRPRVAGDFLCPIRAGAFLSDGGAALPLRFERLLQPLLLAPFVARRDEEASLRWRDAALWFDHGRTMTPLDRMSALTVGGTDVAVVSLGEISPRDVTLIASREDGVAIDAGAWAELQQFEARVYVPASVESRRSGAGAALDDND
jgi:hypothetical protein